jgi:acetamidase/formamidase
LRTGPYRLRPDEAVFDWSTDHAPAIVVGSGAELFLEMLDASGGQLGPDATLEQFRDMDQSRTMPISGPVFVEGAHPGDVLEVEILEVGIGRHGWTGQRPGQGILTAEEFPDVWVQVWQLDGPRAHYREGVSIPLEPFPGMIGVTPAAAGHHSSDPPRSMGGNLDTRQLGAGSRLFLPIEVEGALFGIGDGHAAQGDGEVCGSAIEVPMNVSVRLTVRQDLQLDCLEYEVSRPLERPSAAAAGYYVTTGIEEDLYEAARLAVRRMVAYLARHHRLDPQDAYGLCSVAADLKISEVVDWPNLLVSLFLPKDIFEDAR